MEQSSAQLGGDTAVASEVAAEQRGRVLVGKALLEERPNLRRGPRVPAGVEARQHPAHGLRVADEATFGDAAVRARHRGRGSPQPADHRPHLVDSAAPDSEGP